MCLSFLHKCILRQESLGEPKEFYKHDQDASSSMKSLWTAMNVTYANGVGFVEDLMRGS